MRLSTATPPRPRALRAAFLAAALLAAPLPLAAQSAELDRIDSLVASSRLTEAANALRRWHDGERRRASAGDAAHALLLRGRLATDPDSASAAYLEVALGYPSTRHAPEALLRLGQAALAQGDADRAAGYLERLNRDYPAASQRTVAQLWLARAQRARRRTDDACRTLEAAARETDDADLRALIESDRRECSAPAARTGAASAVLTATSAASGTHAVQVGAFRDPRTAQNLAERLRARGLDARVVYLPGGSLALVRVGSFPGSAAAAETLRRVREIQRDAAIVGDVARERAAP